ncbi:hypothetical protein [Phreatobacter oligotrophus]|uniref:hypothetical protein n=1 Tax=Phreatobacter oligotrophus TaxID=1122261 RepID=UPI0011B1F416|nr:hypothetical protein [Phreatobacter oligotrophus]
MAAAAVLGGSAIGMVAGIVLDVEGLFQTRDLVIHTVAGGFVGGLVALGLFRLLGPVAAGD